MKSIAATCLSVLLVMNFPALAQSTLCPQSAGSTPPSNYPLEAKRYGIEGRSVVAAVVDRSGVVLRVELFKSSGFNLLDAEAMRYARCAKAQPAKPDDVINERWVQVPVNFKLDGTRSSYGFTTEVIPLLVEPLHESSVVAVSIMRNGVMHLGSQPVGLDDLKAELKKLSERQAIEVHIRADEDAPYGKVARVVSLAQSAKASSVRFAVIGPE